MLVSGFKQQLLSTFAKKGYQYNPIRVSDWGDLFQMQALPASLTAAYEGSLFVARATPAAGGTGVALGINVAFVDTTPSLVLVNGESAGGKYYMPVYIRARITAAGSTTSSAEISAEVDNTNRYTSGGTALTASIASSNPANTTASLGILRVGAITAPAAGSNRRFVGQALAKVQAAPCWTVNDTLLITFGSAGQFVHSANVVGAGTTVETINLPFAACAVPPGGSFVLNWANVANATTPPSVEFEFAWIER